MGLRSSKSRLTCLSHLLDVVFPLARAKAYAAKLAAIHFCADIPDMVKEEAPEYAKKERDAIYRLSGSNEIRFYLLRASVCRTS